MQVTNKYSYMLSLKNLVTLWGCSTYSKQRPHYVSSGPLQKG